MLIEVMNMNSYSTLQELLSHDARSRKLFDSLPADVQVALQEQRQDTGSYDALAAAAQSFRQRDQTHRKL